MNPQQLGLRSAARQFPALAADLGYVPPSTNVYDRVTDIDADLDVMTRDGGIALSSDLALGAHTLTSVSAWRYWDWDVAKDRDYTGIPIQRVQRIPSRQDQYSQELRLTSNGDSALSYVGGLYWFKQDIGGRPTSIYGPDATYWLLNPANFSVPLPRDLLDGYGQQGDSDFVVDSYAAFGELNYAMTQRLTATLGLRYTHEDKTGRYATQVFGGLDLAALPAATAAELNRAKLSNIPAVRVRGVEAEFALQLFDGFVLRASGAFADGMNTDYTLGPCPLEVQTAATVACNLSGSRLAGLSRLSGTLGFDYAAASPRQRRRSRRCEFPQRLQQRYVHVAVHADRRLRSHQRADRLPLRRPLGTEYFRTQPVRRPVPHGADASDRQLGFDPRATRRAENHGFYAASHAALSRHRHEPSRFRMKL